MLWTAASGSVELCTHPKPIICTLVKSASHSLVFSYPASIHGASSFESLTTQAYVLSEYLMETACVLSLKFPKNST